MLNLLLIVFGKILYRIIKTFKLGSGSTWPGHIALKVNKHFIRDFFCLSTLRIVIVAGTNGKTTTVSLIRTALSNAGSKVIINDSGANLLNGIASALILNSGRTGKIRADFAVFEIDENNLPLALKEIEPDYLVLLNLFRDQLDRYGEVNAIAGKWRDAISDLSYRTKLVINADDPRIAFLGTKNRGTLYFGVAVPTNERRATGKQVRLEHAVDSVYCPKCKAQLSFECVSFSHLGNWKCMSCGSKRPEIGELYNYDSPLTGIYNKYNLMAAVTVLKDTGLTDTEIRDGFMNFKPAFGRQEIINYKGKKVQIFLSKNPASFNQSYKTIRELGARHMLLVLNDRIPDGKDVSWIWDADLVGIEEIERVYAAGDRYLDLGLRIKYEMGSQDLEVKSRNYNSKFKSFENLKDAIDEAVGNIERQEVLYILPTYSAMLEVRKILTGKKIL